MLTSATSAMRKRLIQIFGFLISTLGWVLVLCTLAMDYWRVTQLGGQGGSFVIRVLWYWSNLWKDCSADSTAVANCRDFPTLWDVTRKCFTCPVHTLILLCMFLIEVMVKCFMLICVSNVCPPHFSQ